MTKSSIAAIAFVAFTAGALLIRTATIRGDQLYGSIRGVVKDQSGAVIPGASVTAIDTGTGISRHVISGADGAFEILNLVVPAVYNVTITERGFQRYTSAAIQLNVNQVYVLSATLAVGTAAQQVTVRANSAQVELTTIELGTTVNSRSIVDLPLNGRDWVQLQQLEPGVVDASDSRGSFATNGSQPEQNSYLINGTDDNDLPLNTALVVPSPDAIAEFKMVTSTINPEYGRNSGAILNAVIKSGSNQFHGDGFEFYRDTSLNARNFFQPAPAVFHRNQFGGTIGGPVWKNHTFFFFSYQGTRESRPESGGDCGCATPGAVPVFTSAQRSGAFPDLTASSNTSPFPLVGDDGVNYPAGTPYSTIFSAGAIPSADFNSVSAGLLNKYVPSPTVGTLYEFNPAFRLTADQYLGRIDHTISGKDSLWGYFLWEREPDTEEVPFTGATLPGFGQTDQTHEQQYTAAWNHTFNGTTLNEARIGYTRLNFASVFPQTPTAPSSAGFTGIHPQLTSGEGLPVVNVLGYFDLGFSTNGPQPRTDQTYQATDNFTKVAGNHTLKFGFDMRRFEVYNPFSHINDGVFNFNHAGAYSTGDSAADFLLGIPDSYSQGSGDILNERTQEYYSYAQDQWKIRQNLTLTYGAGWSIDTPNVDNYHNNHAGIAFRPGQQSTVFPSAPAGYVFQGDPGVNAFGTTRLKDIGPRFGFAYSPDWGRLTGGPGRTSIRAGFGIYFNRFNGETTTQTQGSPPFSLNSSGVTDANATNPALPTLIPSFANPFADIAGQYTLANKFPYAPSSTPDFSLYYPLFISVYDPNIAVPYAENFNLTVERQLGASTILSLAYVGSAGHRLLMAYELNPGINPAGCAATKECAAFPGYQPVLFPGNYAYPGNIFASIGNVATVGNSNYNSFQASLERHFSHGMQFLAAYTWSHAMDDGSGFENSGFGGSGAGGFGQLRSINPFNREAADYGPSIYDATNRLVVNYVYELPSVRRFNSFAWLPSRLTDGWQISGITTFQSGFPLDVVDSSFPSLTSSYYTYYTYGGGSAWDVPNVAGPAQYLNPRTNPTNLWFSPSGFSAPAIGTEGNAGRDLLRGPGRNNFDFALEKETQITESKRIELRFEFFNLFNHTQFDPGGITTDFNSAAFGTETAAFDPRVIQLGAKFYF
ncbi:MAG: carboxypeptidase regulatory-like domain-containing protein [Terriglobia bacterium]